MTNKFRPKNNEVEAIQLSYATLGVVIQKIMEATDSSVTKFEIVNVSEENLGLIKDNFWLEFGNGAENYIRSGEYVVFNTNQFGSREFDSMSEHQFKEMFEPVPTTEPKLRAPGEEISDIYKKMVTPMPQPFQPRVWPNEFMPWQQVIVTD